MLMYKLTGLRCTTATSAVACCLSFNDNLSTYLSGAVDCAYRTLASPSFFFNLLTDEANIHSWAWMLDLRETYVEGLNNLLVCWIFMRDFFWFIALCIREPRILSLKRQRQSNRSEICFAKHNALQSYDRATPRLDLVSDSSPKVAGVHLRPFFWCIEYHRSQQPGCNNGMATLDVDFKNHSELTKLCSI